MQPLSSSRTAVRTIQLAPVLAGAAVALLMLVPRTAPASLALLLLATLMAAQHRVTLSSVVAPPAPVLVTLLIAAWAMTSAAWSADPTDAAAKALLLVLYAGAVWLAARTIEDASAEQLRGMARALTIVFGACLLYLLIEEATGHVLKRTLFALVPMFRPNAKHMAGGGDDQPLAVSFYISNRNMAAMTLLLWPTVLLIRTLAEPRRRGAVTAIAVSLAVIAAALSVHETSMIALAASLVVLAIASRLPRLALGLVAAGWLAATLLVVPAANYALHGAQLHKASWLPNSARQRIVLWAFTAEQVANRPLIGVGAAATKVLDARRGPDYALVPGTRFEWRSTPHAHNVYLQTWYELGAVGALLLAALGLSIVRLISRLSPAVQPFAAATMTAAAITGSFTWGMWQPWFMAAFAAASVLALLAAAVKSDTMNARADP